VNHPDILATVPAASVVIPTRNRRQRLEHAVRSVQRQTLNAWELVVVDDASSDDTRSFLAALRDPRVRPEFLDRHSERSSARNSGLALATSPAVLFLDDDDELLPGALGALTDALARHPEACAAVGRVIHEAEGTRSLPPFPKRATLLDVRLELLAGWVALGGQTLFRRSLLNGVGGWREGLSVAEDQELWLRVSQYGPVAIVPDHVLVHRPHGLAGDAPGGRDVERDVVQRYLDTPAGRARRARRAAAARERLRDADISFQLGDYPSALRATLQGVIRAPFLLASPLVGRGIARGLANALIATALPRTITDRLRVVVRRRRARSVGDGS
jgi:glycosyltransferase involved in cell wall biosynthesis